MWWKAGVIGLVWVYLHICSPFVSFDQLFTDSGNDSGDQWWLRFWETAALPLRGYSKFSLYYYYFFWRSIKIFAHVVQRVCCSATFPPCRGNRRPLLLQWLQSGNQQGEGKRDRRESRDQMEKYCKQKYGASATSQMPHMHKWVKHTSADQSRGREHLERRD